MKVYITKWWQAKGIVEDEGGTVDGPYYFRGQLFLRVGRDAFHSLEEAEARVTGLAAKKVASLKKTIRKIESEWL